MGELVRSPQKAGHTPAMEIWNARRVQDGEGDRSLGLEGRESHVTGVVLHLERQELPREGFKQERVGILLAGVCTASVCTRWVTGSLPPAWAAHSRAGHSQLCLGLEHGLQAVAPVPEALSPPGILPFPRGDHSHAGRDHQQPQGVESACRRV